VGNGDFLNKRFKPVKNHTLEKEGDFLIDGRKSFYNFFLKEKGVNGRAGWPI